MQQLLLLLLVAASTRAGAAEFLEQRARPDALRARGSRADNPNIITSQEKAEEVLKRYGYLQCGSRRRRNRHRGGGRDHDEFWAGPRSCSSHELRRAVRLYQRNYSMPETGLLDPATLRLMSESRCGNPDIEAGALPQRSARRRKHERRKARGRGKRQAKPRRVDLPSVGSPRSEPTDLPVGRGATTAVARSSRATLTRRRRWLRDYVHRIETGQADRRACLVHSIVQSRRRNKRSVAPGFRIHIFAKEVVTWRLIGSAFSNQLTAATQRAAIALAFRMWGEVIPVVFEEDLRSPVDDVDILVAFGRECYRTGHPSLGLPLYDPVLDPGEHLSCQNNFDGFGGQLSHVIRMAETAEIHVDDDEQLTVASEQGTNLVKVAVHEVGHALGLHHTPRNSSIMYAIYSRAIPNSNFELCREDRTMAQEIYGICKVRFDTAFDWVRQRPDGHFIYNSYFFRGPRYWMYENRYNRTRYGDPLLIVPEWKGIPTNVDAFAHVWTHLHDATYFFKGKQYYRYDNVNDRTMSGYPRNISDDFRAIPGTESPNIPSHIDSAFFDKRDGNLYFFKGGLVYAYDVSRGHEGCCLPGYPRSIVAEFPAAPDQGNLPQHVDAVYYSYTDRSMYFFKGTRYWQNVAYNPLDRRRTNRIAGPREISSKWFDICDVQL